MKSFTIKALAVAAAAACGTSAFAGTQTATQRNYALEAITNTTPVTLDSIVTTIGVARTTAQDFTVVVRPQSASTKFSGTCPALVFSNGSGSGAAAVSQKRASTTECVYEVDVSANFVAADNATLTLTGLVLQNHSLATEGATESIGVGFFDLGETARIDNSNDLVNVVAKSFRAVTLVAAQDNNTSADVLFNGGNSPLFGFIAQGGDTNLVAEANFVVNVNGSLTNAGGTLFNAHVDVTKITFTVTGDQDGLDMTNSSVVVNGGNAAGVAVAGSGSSATATFNAAGTAFQATGNSTVQVRLRTAATKSLGTSRTFGVSAVVDPALSGVADQTLSGNANWWVWTANAIELRSAFFNNDTSNGNLTRFFFQNTGAAASYSATCYGEANTFPGGATTPTYGTKRSGVLDAGTTAITASDICTFDKNSKRGSITFTINSSAGKIKGVYQQAINGAAASYIPLDRPYNNANPTY
ncbi:hypothetical protein [Roseateles asaccharophilus]|uniref:Uncharacterized protein n=1 Tax=Roseateles asaccharophilus TaxID=582607 RepID=A0ABU2ADZ7_9BURK|nr:hypothetical protein [Roseateles asaccharophilus]MDR7334707.1 hypothetical protein [Roseateles asaccharophilus]